MSGTHLTPGERFKQALSLEKPLQIVGTINALTAMMAKQAGFRTIYLSGAGVANASCGVPDLGITNLADVLTDVRRITNAVDLPLLVDIDTGWGGAFTIARTIRELIQSGAAAAHLEDQVQAKRCGHRPNIALVPTAEMVDRIKAAVDAKTDPTFLLMARTDALGIEGLNSALDRIHQYIEAGADMIFFEGVKNITDYEALTSQCTVPVLANITEFGVTPLFTKEELMTAGIQMILYPLSAFRAMNKAAFNVYQTIRQEGTQKTLQDTMQTRKELYEVLNYLSYEKKLDELFAKGDHHE